MEDDELRLARLAERELDLVSAAIGRTARGVHLDMASRYGTLRELASAPRRASASSAKAIERAPESVRSSPLGPSGPNGSWRDGETVPARHEHGGPKDPVSRSGA